MLASIYAWKPNSEKKSVDTPILYVFVRTDMSSMTPGKAQAHSGHAANAFVHQHVIKPMRKDKKLLEPVTEWMSATPFGFGTQINLKAPWDEVVDLVARVAESDVGFAEIIIDPTYPYLVDSELLPLIDAAHHTVAPIDLGTGKFACHRSEATAAYVFGYKEDLKQFVGEYPLHP